MLTIGDLVQHDMSAFMILWPRGMPGTKFTPSPYMDQLRLKSQTIRLQTSEINAYQLLASEEVKPGPPTKQLGKTRKPGGEYIEILLYHVYKLLRLRIHIHPP